MWGNGSDPIMNIAEIEMQLAELIKEPFDRAEFALRVLEIYNAPKATLTKLRSGTQNKGEQPGDMLWSRKLFFRPAAQGPGRRDARRPQGGQSHQDAQAALPARHRWRRSRSL